MSRTNVDLIELWLKEDFKGSFECVGGGKGFFVCVLYVCVFSFFPFFSPRNVCDNNEDSVHRLSQAVSFDFKVMWLEN